jgi:LmbE family N-acetylglucosaminyl deacetylase
VTHPGNLPDPGRGPEGLVEVTAPGQAPALWRPLLQATPPLGSLPVSPGDPVTVVVPHPDDETLGTAGLLRRLSAAGARLTIVTVTDGAAGYPGCTGPQSAELARLRRQETADALRTLGLEELHTVFFDLADGTVAGHGRGLTARLRLLLAQQVLCLAPWSHDPHPDHQAVGRAAIAACAATGTPLWQYPIWMRHSVAPDDPRVPLDQLVTLQLSARERKIKRAAIEAHASQLRSPFPGYGPVLPEHVLALFDDGFEPYFVPVAGAAPSSWIR